MEFGLLALGLGSLVGLILALSGAGGGIIAVPLLVFGLNLSMQAAAPIGLLAVGLAAALGAALGFREGILRYRAAALIGTFGVLCAPLGVWLAQHLPNTPLLIAFALVLAWTGWQGWRKSRAVNVAKTDETCPTGQPCRIDPGQGRFAWNLPCARALAGTGMVSGLLSGLLGVGGGFVIVPALARYSDLTRRSILATSMGVITLVALGGVGSALVQGSLNLSIALPFSGGALLGLLVGQVIARRVQGKRLEQAFALLCLAVALLLLGRAAGIRF